MSRRDDVTQLAPVAPPCFHSRLDWLEYLAECAGEQRAQHEPGPLIFTKGQPVRFNYEFAFCADCASNDFVERMNLQNRCKPGWLAGKGEPLDALIEGLNRGK